MRLHLCGNLNVFQGIIVFDSLHYRGYVNCAAFFSSQESAVMEFINCMNRVDVYLDDSLSGGRCSHKNMFNEVVDAAEGYLALVMIITTSLVQEVFGSLPNQREQGC